MNTAKLMGKIAENGMSVEKLSYIMGINKATFYKKMEKKYNTDFYRREMMTIKRELHLTDRDMKAIFFAE